MALGPGPNNGDEADLRTKLAAVQHSSMRDQGTHLVESTWVVFLAAAAFIGGIAFGYFQTADASRVRSFLDGHALGAYEAACLTDSILTHRMETGFDPHRVSEVAVLLADMDADDLASTGLFGRDTDDRLVAEVYRIIGWQFGLSTQSFVPLANEPRVIRLGDQDKWGGLEAVALAWYGRSSYGGDPRSWWSDFSMACAELLGDAHSDSQE